MPTPLDIIREGEILFDEKFKHTDKNNVGYFPAHRTEDVKSHIRSTIISLIKSQIEHVEAKKVNEGDEIPPMNNRQIGIRIKEIVSRSVRVAHNSALTTIITDMKALLAELEK
jgi:hypothetical protein